MKVAIMQPYFLPYIGYFQLINSVDKFVIYDDVNYIKKGYINRNNILINGKTHTFTLELIKASQNKKINEIEIGANKEKIFRTIEMAYKKAPVYNEISSLLKNIILYDNHKLSSYLENSIVAICKYLDIKTEIFLSSNIDKNNSLKGEDKIIEICKLLNADEYVNPPGGKDLYKSDNFKINNIKLQFQEVNILEYKQFGNEFVPNLSIIDMLMFNIITQIKNNLL